MYMKRFSLNKSTLRKFTSLAENIVIALSNKTARFKNRHTRSQTLVLPRLGQIHASLHPYAFSFTFIPQQRPRHRSRPRPNQSQLCLFLYFIFYPHFRHTKSLTLPRVFFPLFSSPVTAS